MIYHPKELLEEVERKRKSIGEKEFIVCRNANRLRESWCASWFGVIFSQRIAECKIEMEDVDEQLDYDFKLHAFGSVHPFQLVEVLDVGRRRDREYKYPDTSDEDESDGFVPRVYAPARIKEAVESKIKKRYANQNKLHLLLYANFEGVEAGWVNILIELSSNSASFASLWVMTGNAICCVHSGTHLYGPNQWQWLKNG